MVGDECAGRWVCWEVGVLGGGFAGRWVWWEVDVLGGGCGEMVWWEVGVAGGGDRCGFLVRLELSLWELSGFFSCVCSLHMH